MARLTRDTLATLDRAVDVPAYDPAAVTTGIVHFGVGGFHRAHEAMYVDRLLRTGVTDWGICGVGLLPGDARMRDVLRDQDHLYTLMTVAPDGTADAGVVAAIHEYLFAPDDPGAVLAKLAEPGTRIVSLTITEGGYSVDDTTGEFAPQDGDTLADLADDAPWRTAPRSALGYLVAALAARRAAGAAPFAVMSCDNIQGNGGVARTAVVGFAGRKDPELAAWIAEHVAFPNSMVDRITPATTDETCAEISRRYGVEDEWPIRAEHFTQWVLEDDFPAGRPALETVGVQVVEDVEPYELMKLRLLNASHQAISYTGALAGYTLAHEVCHDPVLREFLHGYMREALPSLRPVPGVDLPAYCEQLIERFGSEYVADTLARLATDGSDRIAKFLVPVLRHQLAAGGPIGHCVLIVAAWSRYLQGDTPVAINDRRADDLRAAVAAEEATPGAFVTALPAVFGDVAGDQRFVEAFVTARRELADDGVHARVAALKD